MLCVCGVSQWFLGFVAGLSAELRCTGHADYVHLLFGCLGLALKAHSEGAEAVPGAWKGLEEFGLMSFLFFSFCPRCFHDGFDCFHRDST